MAKRNDLTDDEILAKIEAQEATSYGINDSELSEERASAIDRYLGKPYGNEIDGRSQVVSTDVADTIESILPSLLKVFMSGDEVVRFDPKGPEDIEAAQQETDVVNHLVLERNNGFFTFYTWFKDALLSKNGYVKVYWEEREEVETETYQGLTDEEFAFIVQSKEVEVVEHTQYPDEIDAQMRQQAIEQALQNPDQFAGQKQAAQIQAIPAKMLHDVKVQTKETKGCIEIEPVAPEAMMVSVDTNCVSVQDATFVQHREQCTIADLREDGFDVPDDIGYDEDSDQFEQEAVARDLYSEQDDHEAYNGAERKLLVRDTYIRIDGELWRYVVVGQKIIHREEAEVIPFAAITPVIMPHRHIGRSVADLVEDIAEIKTALMRGQLDGLYLALNPRHVISDKVNLDDMLVSRPGGVVRTMGLPGESVMPLITPDVSSVAYPMIEYMDGVKENRTGVTRYNQGLDANSLNKTATGVNQIMTAAQQRIELVARIFAETGVKELFYLVHRLTKQHSQREMALRLRNKWVTVDPRQWKTRTDLTVSVGLGTGNKDQQLMHLMTILQAQREAIAIGIATPKNIFNALTKLTQNAGFRNAEEFWTDPEQNPAPKEDPQPSPDAVLLSQTEIEKARIQAEKDKEVAYHKAMVDYQKAIDVASIDAQTQARTDAASDLKNQRDYTMHGIKLMAEHLMAGKSSEEVMAAGAEQEPEPQEEPDKMDQIAVALQSLAQAIALLNTPKQVIRDANGRAVGIQAVGM